MSKLDQAAALIDQGRFAEARVILAGIRSAPSAPDARARLAACHRMAGNLETSLRILGPRVRPEKRRPGVSPTPWEVSEYGAALHMVGAVHEASALLKQVDVRAFPHALLHRAFCELRQWDWDAARPILERYLTLLPKEHRNRFAVRIYLASCHLHGDGAAREARHELNTVLEELGGRHRALARTALILLAQAEVTERRISAAGKALDTLERFAREDGDHPMALAAAKWRAMAELFTPKRPAALRSLEALRGRLAEAGLWDRIRGIDYHLGIFLEREENLLRVWHGSPFPALKARLEGSIPAASLARSYAWKLSAGSPRFELSVRDGTNSAGGAFLKEGQLSQRLLAALCLDHYRPPGIAELHERVYPDQFFNPLSSRIRVHQALHRLRAWFEGHRLPVVIREHDGLFRLAPTSQRGCRILLSRAPSPIPARLRDELARIRADLGSRWFTIEEAARAIGASRPTALRCLAPAIAARAVETRREGRALRYRFPS